MAVPLVSVVIPAYNSASTLGATIRSALSQTFTDIELIVVDDGSQDDTLAVAKSITDARVRALSQPNGGAAAARNSGIRAANGRYVALLDADDLWLAHKLDRQLAILTSRPEVHAVQAGAIFVDDSLNILSVRQCAPSKDALLETLLFKNMPNSMSTLLIARHKFEEMGYFDPELAILEEWDMMIKVARHCNLVSIEEPLSLYRVHPGNRSRDVGIHIKPGYTVLDRLFRDPTLAPHIRARKRLIYSHFYTMLAGGSYRSRRWVDCATWATKALLSHPQPLAYMASLPIRRVKRWRSRRNATIRASLPVFE